MWRESLGMTQRQFAGALGIERHTLGNWEQRTTAPRSVQWEGIKGMITRGEVELSNLVRSILMKENDDGTRAE